MFNKQFFEDPYPVYRAMRAAAPVHRVDVYGTQALACFRYEDCVNYLRDPRMSSRKIGGSKVLHQFDAALQSELAEYDRVTQRYLLWMDDPRHSAIRRVLSDGFSPAAVEKLRPAIVRQVNALLEPVADAREFDLVRDVVHSLPSAVVTFVLGLPLEDAALVRDWSDAIVTFAGSANSTPEMARKGVGAVSAAFSYFRAEFEDRRSNPRDDLISRMLASCPEGFDTEDLAAQCVLIVTAGHKTTRDVIGNGILALLRNPDALRELRENPELIRTAVEEILRYETPNQTIPRYAREDMTVHGFEMKRGDMIGIMLASANRDPERFEDAERFDIRRKDNAHIAFGGGPHACIGSYLARVDSQIAIMSVVQRFPGLQLATQQIDWDTNFAFRGLHSLPVATR